MPQPRRPGVRKAPARPPRRPKRAAAARAGRFARRNARRATPPAAIRSPLGRPPPPTQPAAPAAPPPRVDLDASVRDKVSAMVESGAVSAMWRSQIVKSLG